MKKTKDQLRLERVEALIKSLRADGHRADAAAVQWALDYALEYMTEYGILRDESLSRFAPRLTNLEAARQAFIGRYGEAHIYERDAAYRKDSTRLKKAIPLLANESIGFVGMLYRGYSRLWAAGWLGVNKSTIEGFAKWLNDPTDGFGVL